MLALALANTQSSCAVYFVCFSHCRMREEYRESGRPTCSNALNQDFLFVGAKKVGYPALVVRFSAR